MRVYLDTSTIIPSMCDVSYAITFDAKQVMAFEDSGIKTWK